MACTSLTKGRGLDCNRVSGGIKYVYFGVADQIDSITVSSSEVTDIEMTVGGVTSPLYRYAVPRGSTSISETVTGSTENGTISYQPTLSMVINRLTKEDQNEIKLLGQTQVVIFVQLNATKTSSGQDIIMAMGVKNAMSLNSGSAASGAAFSDRNGYTLNFEGFEPAPSPILKDHSTGGVPFDNIDDGGVITIDPS
jgi:hypothetical protein